MPSVRPLFKWPKLGPKSYLLPYCLYLINSTFSLIAAKLIWTWLLLKSNIYRVTEYFFFSRKIHSATESAKCSPATGRATCHLRISSIYSRCLASTRHGNSSCITPSRSTVSQLSFLSEAASLKVKGWSIVTHFGYNRNDVTRGSFTFRGKKHFYGPITMSRGVTRACVRLLLHQSPAAGSRKQQKNGNTAVNFRRTKNVTTICTSLGTWPKGGRGHWFCILKTSWLSAKLVDHREWSCLCCTEWPTF